MISNSKYIINYVTQYFVKRQKCRGDFYVEKKKILLSVIINYISDKEIGKALCCY